MAFIPQLADQMNMVVNDDETPPDFDALDMRAGDDNLYIPAPSFDPSASDPPSTIDVVLEAIQNWNPALTSLILQKSTDGAAYSLEATLDPFVPDPDVTTENNVTFTTLTNATTSLQTIQKNGGAADTWDSGGTTTEFIPRYQRFGRAGYFEVRVGPVDEQKSFGITLGTQKTIDNRVDMDWHILFTTTERVNIYNPDGDLVHQSATAYWTSTDYFQIEIEENDIVFKKNSTEFYRAKNVLTLADFPIYGGYAFYTSDAQLQLCVVAGNSTAAARYSYAATHADAGNLEGNRYWYRFQVDTDTVTDQNGPAFDDYTDAIIDIDGCTDGGGAAIDDAVIVVVDESDFDGEPVKSDEGQEKTDVRVWTNRTDSGGLSNIRVPGNLDDLTIFYIKNGKGGGIKAGVIAQE